MPDAPKFVADAMLGSLARKLRIFGFDTAYFSEGEDRALQSLAVEESRVILTSDEALFAQSKRRGIPAYLIKGTTDRARLASLWRQAGLPPEARRGLSRCAVCNGALENVERDRAFALGVPAKVVARHRLFFRCAACGKLYWRGRHWQRLWRLR